MQQANSGLIKGVRGIYLKLFEVLCSKLTGIVKGVRGRYLKLLEVAFLNLLLFLARNGMDFGAEAGFVKLCWVILSRANFFYST